MATIGSSCTRSWKDSAEDAAIAASSSEVGFWFRPESANTNAPFAPYSQLELPLRRMQIQVLYPVLFSGSADTDEVYLL